MNGLYAVLAVAAAIGWMGSADGAVSDIRPEGDLLDGPLSAPVAVHYYCDYLDRQCALWNENVRPKVDKEYFALERASLSFFSRPGSEASALATHAAGCATNQNYFRHYHDQLYKRFGLENRVPGLEDLVELADVSRLDVAKFERCMDSYGGWDGVSKTVPYFVFYGGDRPREFPHMAGIEHIRSEINTILKRSIDGTNLGTGSSSYATVIKFLQDDNKALEARVAILEEELAKAYTKIAELTDTLDSKCGTTTVGIFLDRAESPAEYRAAYEGIADHNRIAESGGTHCMLEGFDVGDTSTTREARTAAALVRENGITVGIGPASDESTRLARIHLSDITMIGCCSGEPDLGLPADGIYRLLPDETGPGRALGSVLNDRGIQTAVAIYDAAGSMLQEGVSNTYLGNPAAQFEYRDGVAGAANQLGNVDAVIEELVDTYSPDQIAIYYIGDDPGDLLSEAALYENLAEATWFATSLPELDEDTAAFAEIVGFTAVVPADGSGPGTMVNGTSLSELAAYDAARLAGIAVQEAGSGEIEGVIAGAVTRYTDPSLGTIRFDVNGDHQGWTYKVWSVSGGELVDEGTARR